MKKKLGVNIDHIATLRQLRGTAYPNLYEAAKIVESAGADQITIHLREDRRHIQDADVMLLRKKIKTLLNLEMAATDEMVKFAIKIKPDFVCLVPEKREERTTEGGLAVSKNKKGLEKIIHKLSQNKIKTSLFIEPSLTTLNDSFQIGAPIVEFHTGRYCNLSGIAQKKELVRIKSAIEAAIRLGVTPNAGHGLDYQNIKPLLNYPIEEFNIGHSIICYSVFVGLSRAVKEMAQLIQS